MPGRHGQLDKAADGGIEVVRWRGQLARDATGRFARYDDGSEAAWIGPCGSERPAPVTRVGAVTAPADDDSSAGAAAPAVGGGLLLAALAIVVARRRRDGPRAAAW